MVYSLVFGRSGYLLLKKIFDLSTPSMRKVDEEENWNYMQELQNHFRGDGGSAAMLILLI